MPGFTTCGPNEVMVVSGLGYKNSKLIPGGCKFVWPFLQRVQKLSLNLMTLAIESPNVYTRWGVAVSVTGIAQVKVQGQNHDMLAAACELFLGKHEREICNVAMQTLEGHQRAIMGDMTVEEIYRDRKKFSKAVFEVASSDLVNMGICVVSYTIAQVSDDEGYLKSLGKGRTAEVKRDARIGEADAQRDAGIKISVAEERRMASRYANDIQIAKSQRDYDLKKASYDMEVNTRKAQSELAYALQAAKTKQKIKDEQMQIRVIERTRQIELQEQEILRRERELEAQVRKPAEAEKFRLEKIANANKIRVIMEAEGEAEAIRVKGEAEAFAIEAKAKAEAEQMAKKADAWKDYQESAMIDMVLETLPKITAEISAPLCHAKKITMVASGKGEIGASRLTGEVISIVAKIPDIVENLTGINLSKSIKHSKRRT
ncbi:hypothetical protein ScPMuIL_010174 [Solemya velum]